MLESNTLPVPDNTKSLTLKQLIHLNLNCFQTVRKQIRTVGELDWWDLILHLYWHMCMPTQKIYCDTIQSFHM